MLEMAAEYGIETWTSLELLKAMLDAGHITMDRVRMVVDQWVHDGDLPAKALRGSYVILFGEEPPAGF